MRMLPGIPNLRVVLHRAVRTALIHGRQKQSFRLVYFAILSNHLHLIIEADSTQTMSRGVQGIAIRLAQNINKALGRKRGRVFSDRYHQRVLRTPTQTRAAIHYVINNYRKHMAEAGQRVDPKFIDRLSSAHYLAQRAPSPFPAPETWLLKTGYRRSGGEIDLYCTPGVRRRPRKPVDSAGPVFNRAVG